MSHPHLLSFEETLSGKRILVTGHTGFTGSWACLWLKSIGAEVAGCSLLPDTDPSLFRELGIENGMASAFIDIRDYDKLSSFLGTVQPEVILHLAAQPLVRRGYREPLATFMTNALGTVHVLEAARQVASTKGVVCVTTDKVYRNNEWPWPYRENDALGGKDPYSGSKAAAEMAIESYRTSFAKTDGSAYAIATARGGNIIGGGDWSEDRLIPDFVRAVTSNSRLTLRYPEATRPWQHVLALVQGYLMLLAGLLQSPHRYATAWNFGPHDERSFTVTEVLELLSSHWVKPDVEFMDSPLPEAHTLTLDSSMARNQIGWVPAWGTVRGITETALWYREFYRDRSRALMLSLSQLETWRVDLAGMQR